ncbi:hypothetical protein NBRGN_099_00360 [Nocardia brasiliensis NBRC 14402]|uniref:hypothetical protein n=1 Tax=Nocardia brasiliensis TaxID=37326 RepID=UPI0002FC7A29|nr:hypothetical protein [Nocardia brasiliensis]ASF08540.1 hypothetical protein CEQ30_15500 [Nocardia brasiliensis]GAJ85813.1 hypothetical protein NBRGN_099_00360 [Nocardia brasiliensis NBRC 14402]SUB40965.1 Uncharacterised protein [Nocardia brasiliensis]
MHAYIGSVPYCYSNSLAMLLGAHAPSPAVIETLTGSPFGVQLEGGTVPFFDPVGWHPEIGVRAAIELLGWSCTRSAGGPAPAALERLRDATRRGPVLAGPLDLGLLTYRPGAEAALGADHYVVVLAVAGDTVLLHDPQGHPFATLPTEEFLESWRGERVTYSDTPFVLRSDFVREREVSPVEALASSMPQAIRWTAGASDAAAAIADLVTRGLPAEIRGLLAEFGIRVGSRRLIDAAVSLTLLGRTAAAELAATQARLIGSLQYPLVAGDDSTVAATLRELAPGYDRLGAALA